ncbi:protein IL-40 isoform X2 [Loxodonta africana]|uniref:protein IL-40 isoform X2 n=1 Tax=Loxodonta africana TaxID=9785 RepID=UPI0030D58AF2
MRLLLLLHSWALLGGSLGCLQPPPHGKEALLTNLLSFTASRGFSKDLENGDNSSILINYKVVELFPNGCRVLITCNTTQMPRPITYHLWDSQGTTVAEKVVNTSDPASFTINITLESSSELLSYSCHVDITSSQMATSDRLQIDRRLCTTPLSQLQAKFTLVYTKSGPMVEVICQASSGSPSITYSLVQKNGSIHSKQIQSHGQPAKFFFPLARMATCLQCQAENGISILSSTFMMIPSETQLHRSTLVLAGSLTIIALTSGMLAWGLCVRRTTPSVSQTW